MKKLLIVLVLLVAVVGVVVWRLYANLDSIVAQAIEETGTEVTGTAVAVSGVELQLLDGKAAVSGIDVANPPGFPSPSIFRLGRIAVAIDIESLSDGPIVIDELLVSQPQVFLEMNGENRSNLKALKNNIDSYATADAAQSGASTATQDTALRFIIRKLVFDGGHLSASSALAPDKPAATDLPGFEMTDLGKARGGATAGQLAGEILERLIKQAGRAAGQAGMDAAQRELKDKARDKLEDKFGGALNGILEK